MANITPKFAPGTDITYTASAAVTGGRLVTLTGNRRVGPAGAGSTVIGVPLRDAALEEKVTVAREGVFMLRAAAAIAAGDRLIPAANGEVQPVGAAAATGAATAQTQTDIENSRDIIGFALEAIAAGADGQVALTLA